MEFASLGCCPIPDYPLRSVNADLTGADLSHANLSKANLTGANLTDVKLDESRQTSPLWNARQFTKNVESAYRQMWQIYCES